MNYLFIDIGTYSIKFLKVKLERGKIIPISVKTTTIGEAQLKWPNNTIEELQINIIKDYLKSGFEGKITYQLPNEYITSRFIQLPVTNKKKAEMMIPFQLDGQLPYPIYNSHYTSSLKKYADHFKAMVCVAKEEDFAFFYKQMNQSKTLPNILTTELATINHFTSASPINYPYAIIDMGHTTTKAYFIQNGVVTSNHISYVGGKLIDSFISKTYNLSIEEVIPYKHKNCFFLTESQFHEVNQSQKEFAYLIKQIIWPLIQEIKRWSLGHRTHFGKKVEKYFIIGGTSKIKNITNFFSQALEAKVGHLSIREHYAHLPHQISEDEASYSFATIMTSIDRRGDIPFNMLHGKFSTTSMSQMPLHSISFICSRIVFLCLIISVLLLAERFFLLSDDIRSIDRNIIDKLKSPALKLSQSQRASYRRYPERTLGLLKEKNKTISQEVSLSMSSSKVDAVSPLINLGQVIGNNKKVELLSFYKDSKTLRSIIRCEDEETLNKIKQSMQLSAFKNAIITAEGTVLSISFDGQLI